VENLLFVELGDHFKNLGEEVIHKLVSFLLELIVSNEDLVVRVDIVYLVRKLVLHLGGQVRDTACVDAHLELARSVSGPVVKLDELNDALDDLEETFFGVRGDNDKEAEHVENLLDDEQEAFNFGVKVLIKLLQGGSNQGVSLTDETIHESDLGSLLEQSALFLGALNSGNGDVDVGDASLNKGLRLLGVLAFHEGVALDGKLCCLVDKRLSHGVQVDEHTSRGSVHVQSLVKILAMVNLEDDSGDDFCNSVNFNLGTHEIDLVVEGLCDLEDRVDQEAVVKLFVFLAEETQHHFAQLLFHG